MITKPVSYDMAMDEWANLLDSGTLSKDQGSLARAHLAGLKAEKNMAYYLDCRFDGDEELLIFKNLQIEHRSRTAQIDHLIISRWSIYFIETKSVAQKVNINADGQWSRVYGRRYNDMENPIEQSRRHESLLYDLLDARLSEFMGKILGLQKKFRGLIETHHLIAVSVGASITGKGKKAVAQHVHPLDQIPQWIEDDHKAVRSSFMGSVFAEMANKKTRKRVAAFSKDEFAAVGGLLLAVDISQTPLRQAHEFIESLPAEAERLIESAEEPAAPTAEQKSPQTQARPALPVTDAPTDAPACPKCGAEMILRTARKGKKAGNQFYGCSKFPKCRGIVQAD